MIVGRIKGIIEKAKKSKTFQNIARISFGTLAGQAINLLSLPVFSRMYGPVVTGQWAFLNSISLLINTVSDFGLKQSLMIETDEEKMKQTYRVTTTLSFFVSILSSLIAFGYYTFISPDSVNIVGWFAALFVFSAVFTLQQTQICYTWLNRKSEYKTLMKNPLINNISFAVVAIILGLLGVKKYGYFIGWIVGQVITLVHMRRKLPSGFFVAAWSDIPNVLKRNKKFSIFQMPVNMLVQLKWNLPSLLIKPLFGSAVLGQYSITMRIVNFPVNMLATAIGRVFFKNSSDLQRKGKPVGEFTFSNLTRSMKIATIPIIVIIAFGDIFMNLMMGSGWELASQIIRIMAFYSFILFLVISLSGIAITINKQKYSLIENVSQVICLTVSILLGKYVFNNLLIGLLLLLVISIISNTVYFCALFKAMGVSRKKYLKSLAINLLIIVSTPFLLRLPLVLMNLVSWV